MYIVAATVVPAEPPRATTALKIAPRRLDHAAGKPRQLFQLAALEPDPEATFDHGDGGGNRAALGDRRLQQQRRLQVFRDTACRG